MSTNLVPGQVAIDYIAADFNSVVDDLITFASTTFGPGTPSNRLWTDFNVNSFSRTWLELVAYVSDLIFFYLDNQATEAYLESATLRSSVLNIANQFGYVIPTASSSGGIANFTTSGSATIPAGFIVTDDAGTSYFTTQAGSTSGAGVVNIPVIQGVQKTDTFIAQGIQNETLTLSTAGLVVDSTNIVPTLRSPIVTVNSVVWTQVESFIESFPTSHNYIIGLQPNGQATIMFGDGIMGQQLAAGQQVQINYRTGGGTIGNITATQLVSLGSSAPNVISVTNTQPFSGGTDAPTLAQIQALIPLSLSTLERAVTAPDYGDIILLNFPQISQAMASVANVQTGIDLNIYVVPVGTTVLPITSNPNLLTSIGNFINLHKMVTTQFSILNGLNVALLINIRVFVSANSSRAVVTTNINNALNKYFAFDTGTISPAGTGPTFAQEVLLADVYEILDSIGGIDRFEIKKLTYQPNEVSRTNNINQLSFEDIEVLPHAGKYEYFIATEAVPPNPSGSAIGQYEVFQREYFKISNIADNSISDNTSNFSVLTGTGILNGSVIEETDNQVFIIGQYARGFLIVDSLNNIFKILSNDATTITIDPIPINPTGGSFTNGIYNIVRDYRDLSAGGSKQRSLIINDQIISILYNNVNTLFVIPGAEINTVGTLGDPFIISTKLTLPSTSVSITSVASYPNIQLSPVLISDLVLGQGALAYPVSEYSNYNPMTGAVTVQDSNDLFEIVAGDQLVDSLGNNYQILSGISNTLGSKGFNIRSSVNLVPSFTPTSYDSFTGFLSVPDPVDLSMVTAGSVFIDYPGILYTVLGGVNNTLGSKGFNIQAGLPAFHPSLSIGATVWAGISQVGAPQIVGQGSLSNVQVGEVIIDANGNVSEIIAINTLTNTITVAPNSTISSLGIAEITSSTSLPIPIISTSINATSIPNVFMLGTYLTGADAKIIPGDLLVDSDGTINEISQVPYVTYNNSAAVPYTYTITPETVDVFSNSASVAYTYTSASGLIQYASHVDLSAVDLGDLFYDGTNYFSIFSIDYVNSRLVIPTGQTVLLVPGPGAGGSVWNGPSRGLVQYTSPIAFGLTANLDQFLDSNGVSYLIDTFSPALNIVRLNSAPVSIGLTPGAFSGGSIRAYNLVELAPGFTTPVSGIGATLTRRYYSPGDGVTWVAYYNGFSASEGFLNVNDLGLEPTSSNPADQFTIRTSPWCADITNLRPQEIPTLAPNNINLDLRGGQP